MLSLRQTLSASFCGLAVRVKKSHQDATHLLLINIVITVPLETTGWIYWESDGQTLACSRRAMSAAEKPVHSSLRLTLQYENTELDEHRGGSTASWVGWCPKPLFVLRVIVPVDCCSR